MDCTQAQEEFAALLDGELAPEERAAVEGHLSQCSDCLRDLDGLKRVDTIYRQLSSVSAPEGFEERVRQATRPKPALRFPDLSRQRQMKWSIVVAAAVFLLVVGAVVLQFGLPVKEEQMTVASLEQKAATPASQSMAQPPAEAQPDIAIEDTASANAASPSEAAMEAPPPAMALKSKGITAGAAQATDTMPELERDLRVGQQADEVRSAPPATESVPEQDFFHKDVQAPAETVQTFGAPQEAAKQVPVALSAPMAESAAPAAAPEAPKPVAGIALEEKVLPKVEEVGKRVFESKDGVWYESGYTDQKTTRLVRGSNELRKLVSTHSDLGKVLELGERIVFKADGQWYRVDPRAGR